MLCDKYKVSIDIKKGKKDFEYYKMKLLSKSSCLKNLQLRVFT